VGLLVDSDLLIGLERAGDVPLDVLPGDEEVAISVITMSELLHGVHRATGEIRSRRRSFVEWILAEFEAIPITTVVARAHAEAWAELAAAGSLIGAHDLWIAATAIAHDLGLATQNRADFERVPGLRVVSPGL
jgi:tRNA(fMet)-specific endonuclease VapC